MNQLLDKNKSTFKLKNIGPIYYVNLDDQPERKEYMESQFKYWEIENYTRISAYDGREDDLSDIIAGRYPEMMTSGEIGCVTSHLKAIKHWYETSDSPYAIIMEDDCNLDLVKYWNFTWTDFYAHIPYDWDIMQIAIICTGDIHVKLHKRFVNDFSTACYLITRHHAEKLLKFHVKGDKYRLDNGVKPRPVADDLIYNSGNTYSIPLLRSLHCLCWISLHNSVALCVTLAAALPGSLNVRLAVCAPVASNGTSCPSGEARRPRRFEHHFQV
jgi:hypothetical protein